MKLKKLTSKQLADLEEKKIALVQRLQIWRPIQLAYMPHVSSLLPSVNDDTAQDYANPKLIPLLLPSFLPSKILSLPDMRKLALQECRLCESQANDTLMDIRHLHHIIQGLWHFKHVNISGTGN